MAATYYHPQWKPQRIRGILFDMDGLILDSEKLYSRFWMAAGEMSAMKSSTVQCSFPNARRTSASVFWYISLVVPFHEYCLISSLNMAYSFRNAVSGDEADAIIPVAIPPNPAL